MFGVVCVACRGEIAVRVIRGCRALGIESVALHAPDDADGMHVRLADRACEVPSYLDARAVAAAARAAGAEALHPGYGFLSEDASLAEACAEQGVVFVGPSPAALRALARKDEARRIAQSVGVDPLPGGDDPHQLGFPLLVKAAAGGGGRGMRVVRNVSELDTAIAAAAREAEAAFGDGTLLFEHYVEEPRHVEIQLLRDADGRALQLGERECSVQRRHQKVLEESPAPGFPHEARVALGQAALRLAEAVDYVGAGTVEFLVDESGRCFFLEMNARIQVEHPVTEAVTAVDVVRRQLEIAAGLGLALQQGDVLLRGHAVEARVYAEDPDAGYVPSAGRLLAVRWPAGPGIRVDAGYEAGDVVGTRYDPLLAKIVAHGETREHALARLAAALDEALVLGVTTNLALLRWLVRDAELGAGPVSTRFLERRFVPAPAREVPAEALAAAERFAAAETGGSPWQGRWRPPAALEPAGLAVSRDEQGALHVWLDGRSWRLDRRPLPDVAALSHAGPAGAEGHALVDAPMPGTVVRVDVREGDAVVANQPLLVLEAMKMEHPLVAPFDATVLRVACRAGDQVRAGEVLAELGPA